jgi:hypothetical protein
MRIELLERSSSESPAPLQARMLGEIKTVFLKSVPLSNRSLTGAKVSNGASHQCRISGESNPKLNGCRLRFQPMAVTEAKEMLVCSLHGET